VKVSKRVTALSFVGGLFASSTLALVPVHVGLAADSSACNGSHSENTVTVTPTHGENFYVDLDAASSSNQDADAAYIGYRIQGSAAIEDVWVQVGSFAGGSVVLADANDDLRPLGDLSSGSSATAFFFVKATEDTSTDQTHLVEVFSGKPQLVGSTRVASCTFTFAAVEETLKANSNKVEAITASASVAIGTTYQITVDGDPGQLGDSDVIWLSPAARSEWPTEALRLSSTNIKFYDVNGSACNYSSERESFDDTLIISGSQLPRTTNERNVARLCYRAVYDFQVIGQADASVAPVPIAQITSGSQTKHTDLDSETYTSAASVDLRVPGVDMTSNISASTTVLTDGTSTTIDYTVTLTNSGPRSPWTRSW